MKRLESMKNYFVVGIRYFLRNLGYSLINVVGLAISMAIFLIVITYIHSETNYDRFHKKSSNIYRLGSIGANQQEKKFIMPEILAGALRTQMPEINRLGIVYQLDNAIIKYGENSFDKKGMFVDEYFLHMFKYPFVMGDYTKALSAPNTIVLSYKLAKELFGNQNPMGMTVHYSDKFMNCSLNITGVTENVSLNSHIQFEYLISIATLASDINLREIFNTWDIAAFTVYIELATNQSAKSVGNRLNILLQSINPQAALKDISYDLQPINQIHLRPNGEVGISPKIQMILIYLSIAIAILSLACINSINLSTARATIRQKEINIRKLIGANKSELITQFLVESYLYVSISMAIALLIYMIMFEFLMKYLGANISHANINKPILLLYVIGTAIAVGFISGLYPAVVLSSMENKNIKRGIANTGRKRVAAKRLLIVVQFAAITTIMISMFVIAKQLKYINTKEQGYIRENVLVIRLKENEAISKADELKRKILEYNKIVGVTVSDSTPLKMGMYVHGLKVKEDQGEIVEMDINRANIDYDFIATYCLEIAKGRRHSKNILGDRQGVLVNEAFVRKAGWKNPLKEKIKNAPVIGIVKDFHYETLYKNIEPAAFYIKTEAMGTLDVGVRYLPEDLAGTIEAIKNIFSSLINSQPFEYYFLDDEFNGIYRDEARLSILLRYFQAISVAIGCMGLFGLATFAAQKRKKEIGIRKVVGASIIKIGYLLYKEILVLVIVANCIAWPIGFYLMKMWLGRFAYRCVMGIEMFVASSAATITISIIAVSMQISKASRANPIEIIRYE